MKNIILVTVIVILTFFFGYSVGSTANNQVQADNTIASSPVVLDTPTPIDTPTPQIVTQPLPPCNLAPHNAYHIPTLPCTYMPGYIN